MKGSESKMRAHESKMGIGTSIGTGIGTGIGIDTGIGTDATTKSCRTLS